MFIYTGKNPNDDYLEAMMNEAPGPINFTMFLTMFGEKLNGTDPEDVIRNAFACFDEEGTGNFLLVTHSLMGFVCFCFVFFNLKRELLQFLIWFWPLSTSGFIQEDYLRELLTTMGDRFTDEEVDELFREAPIDKKNNFNYVEFTRILKHGAKDKDD